MQQQSQFSIPDAPLPFKSTVEKAHGILNLMALSVRLPLRRNVGKSRVGVLHLAGMAGVMLGVSFIGNFDLWGWLFGGGSRDSDNSLRNYALLVLALGMWQRRKRISEFKRGMQPHRMHPGDSWLDGFVPVPRKVINAGVEPALVFILGAVLYYQLDVVALGLWLMASAVALCVMDCLYQMQEKERDEADADLDIEARGRAERLRLRPKGAAGSTAGGVAPVTIPTGIGDDEAMRAQIEKNKLENSWSGENDNAI